MADFKLNTGGFAATEVKVAPQTTAGLELWKRLGFGGACSATLRKSGGLEFLDAVVAAGLSYTTVSGAVENMDLFAVGGQS